VEIDMHDNGHNENGTMEQKRSEHDFAPLEGGICCRRMCCKI
jgi:hypothetical protein